MILHLKLRQITSACMIIFVSLVLFSIYWKSSSVQLRTTADFGEHNEKSRAKFLLVCSMHRNGFGYVMEWIYFHRLQGVDSFALYDDFSYQDNMLLPIFLSQFQADITVTVHPINVFLYNRENRRDEADHYSNQLQMQLHCTNRFKNSKKWIMVVDSDEYVYSDHHRTIANYLDSVEDLQREAEAPANIVPIAQILFKAVRFGTNKLLNDFIAFLKTNLSSGNITLLYKPLSESNAYPLLISRSSHRAPHVDLDDYYGITFNRTCRTKSHLCSHYDGKYIFRPNLCAVPSIHKCELLTRGRTVLASVDELRMDHFAFRSNETVHNQMKLQAIKLEGFQKYDRIWFSRIREKAKDRFVCPITSLIDKLEPETY